MKDAIQCAIRYDNRTTITLKFSIFVHPCKQASKEPIPLPIESSSCYNPPFPLKEKSSDVWLRGASYPMPVAATDRRLSGPSTNNNNKSSILKMKFVCDVSIVDGTNMYTNQRFVKIWRVVNDGIIAWPEGTKLVHASGDDFQPNLKDIIIPAAKPNEEIDITVEMIAPSSTGRHIEYFRLQSRDGSFFGVRLWVGVNVLEKAALPSPSANASGRLKGLVVQAEAVRPGTALRPVATVHGRYVDVDESQFDEVDKPVARNSINDPSMSQEMWKHVYSAELAVLREMGFDNDEVNIPLLREYVEAPTAANAIPSAAALQNVVISLLGQSRPPV